MDRLSPFFILTGLFTFSITASAETIYKTAFATPNLSLFAAALHYANTSATFNDSSLRITVFAPSDQAFLKMFTRLGVSQTVLMETAPELAAILMYYHVVRPSAQLSELIAAGAKDWPLAFPFGGPLTLSVIPSSAGVVTVSSLGSDAKVTTANIAADGSVIHVIDNVLLPFYPSVAAVLERNSDLTTLYDAINATVPELLNQLDPLAEVTLFAPTDTAIQAALSGSNVLLGQLRSSPAGVAFLLKYHIALKPVILSAADVTEDRNMTTLAGLKLTLERTGQTTRVRFPTGAANIIDSYQVGLNANGSQRAAVHIIDQLLIPPAMASVAEALNVQSADANTFVAVLNISSTYSNLMSSSNFNGTILVPTDGAFTKFILANGLTLITLFSKPDFVKPTLDLHIIPNKRLSLTTLTDGTQITTNSGPNTLTARKDANGTVSFVSTNNTATGLYEYFAGEWGNGTTLIFIDTVLIPGPVKLSGAASFIGPSPLAMLCCSILATVALHHMLSRGQ